MQAPTIPLKVLPGDPLPLPMFSSVPAGFPSPADDFLHKHIDIGAELVKHPQATYLLRIAGTSMRDAGIFDGDIVVIDKAVEPKHGHIVIAVVDGEFTCKQLFRKGSLTKLLPANPDYPEIIFSDGQTLEVWGVVTSTIKQFQV
ncbi:translesion error-prone DNA polymerase V autoproteolytic subunit [Lampropedia aestuarii]|uniref:Translesion error-prone DNA polymerase V autoproteolytic subunit n=1 Tax=Lampropedia aestuarii TaxID=2562762 RepID=A0A4S5BU08_9BURK|nr:translesion error-prone DNA polymerase V autoproteolytic subunit [Lampropedia aestuarii]THJ36170.1 translesion error-prone DNA polymerase V autoproteolytic subunit [Lampropedia aestuarii]